MTLEEIREQLHICQKNINIIDMRKNSLSLDLELESLKKNLPSSDMWSHSDSNTHILKRIKYIENILHDYTSIISNQKDLLELLDIIEESPEALSDFIKETRAHIRKVNQYKISLLLSQEDDNKNCFLHINAGAGGTEAQDWADMLLRMYLRFCEQNDLFAEILDIQQGEEAGIKSVTLFVKGKFANGLLSAEVGIHRLVRISPYDSNKRRHTSFAAVTTTPDVADINIIINPTDLRIDTYRAGGAGGQHVNKTDSAVRITHAPTGIVVQCQNERSQLQNKESAMKMLKAKLYQKEKNERKAAEDSIEKKKIEWGSQIRSYILHPYKMTKDHRTDHESPQPEKVLDGDIIDFIESYLIQRM